MKAILKISIPFLASHLVLASDFSPSADEISITQTVDTISIQFVAKLGVDHTPRIVGAKFMDLNRTIPVGEVQLRNLLEDIKNASDFTNSEYSRTNSDLLNTNAQIDRFRLEQAPYKNQCDDWPASNIRPSSGDHDPSSISSALVARPEFCDTANQFDSKIHQLDIYVYLYHRLLDELAKTLAGIDSFYNVVQLNYTSLQAENTRINLIVSKCRSIYDEQILLKLVTASLPSTKILVETILTSLPDADPKVAKVFIQSIDKQMASQMADIKNKKDKQQDDILRPMMLWQMDLKNIINNINENQASMDEISGVLNKIQVEIDKLLKAILAKKSENLLAAITLKTTNANLNEIIQCEDEIKRLN